MHILYILLLLPSLLHAHKFDGAWGFSGQFVARNAILTEEAVMNPFWVKMKDAPQEEKISTLINICKTLSGDHNYPDRRYNIAAATYAGIDLVALESQAKKEDCHNLVLHDAALFQDYDLTEFLLKHKANVHEENVFFGPVIYHARTARLAQLFIDFGALKKDTCALDKRTLLHQVMRHDYENALIPLYKKYGIDPMVCNNDDRTPLMDLSIWIDIFDYETDTSVITKASLLLEDLPKEKVIALINAENNDGDTVLKIINLEIINLNNIIKRRSNDTGSQKVIQRLSALHGYLLDTLLHHLLKK